MKHGIDISKHQRSVDKEALSNNPPDFIITRSSYVGSETNTFTVDSHFEQNAPLLKGVAVRGVYHYYASERGWKYQADRFINLIKDQDFDFFAVDMEGYFNHPDEDYALGAIQFFKKVEEVLKIPGIIYTAKYYYQDHLRKYTAEYDNLPLWIASPEDTPSMPDSRDPDDWEIWQYSASGDASKYGFQGNANGLIDLNHMRDAFYEKVKSTSATPPSETPAPPTGEMANLYIQALNSHSHEEVAKLYTANAAHITPKRTIQGRVNIQNWYLFFFAQLLPNATFQLTGHSGTGNSRHITWTAQSAKGEVKNGNDTLGLIDNRITYHFSHFTITESEQDQKYRVTAQSLNVRDKGSFDSNVIGALHEGDVVALLGKSPDLYWYKIKTTWGLEGWASHKFLVLVQDGDDDNSEDPPWLKIAYQERGVKEFAGSADNPRIVEYHKSTTLHSSYAKHDETPWCSSFVNWCMEKSNYEGTDSAWARSWANWGQRLATSRRGCVAVFKRPPDPNSGHVGFYISETANHIRLLGGNQSNEVNIMSQAKDRLLGYRWPVHYED